MLAIRMQRTGRKGHAQFRLIVQESRLTPTSGKLVAQVGTYDPHSKVVTLDKDKVSTYLNNGAQPTPRIVKILTSEGVKLPSWVEKTDKKISKIRNSDKLRKNQPKIEAKEVEAVVEAPKVEDQKIEEPAADLEVVAEVTPVAAAETPVEVPETTPEATPQV